MPTLRQAVLASLMRHYPLYSGCGTVVNLPVFRSVAGPAAGLCWARLRSGKQLLVPLEDYVGRAAFFTGDLDRKISWVCRRVVRRGDVVLDIGANLGLVTMLLSSLVGKDGHVHSFEPNPRMVELLHKSIEHNQLTNVTLHPVALGAQESELDLRVPADHAGKGSLRANAKGQCVRVPVKRLASMPGLPTDRPIRLVKIDVEGYEPEVLRGAEPLLVQNPPQAIVFELNRCDAFEKHPTVEILARHGYGFFALPKRYLRMNAVPVSDPGAGDDSHDFVAVHKGEHFRSVAASLGAPA